MKYKIGDNIYYHSVPGKITRVNKSYYEIVLKEEWNGFLGWCVAERDLVSYNKRKLKIKLP